MARTATRSPLSRERVLQTALRLADRDGLDALTMRALADELDVEAMSIYYHLPNKHAILDGLVEQVFAEVEVEIGGFAPPTELDAADWPTALRSRILGARRVLLRHPWAPNLMNTRGAPGVLAVRYADGVVGIMRAGGLSHDLIHHGLHAIGSRMYGYVQELNDDNSADPPGDPAEFAALAPHLAAMLADVVHDDPDSTLGWCDDQTEFEFGLDLLLEGLERRRAAEASTA
ncbi:TetR/AcrR family transcriptional regulator C-terminal domain-containing protein [Agromyces sp. H3Y2-19a]|uniref:TetR/AcrR family transcriptional regulator n=1 Tax=Agromyces TaxID=33877 RepID=UPI001E6252FD|nr:MULTISPECIES: TetR/AcrR family transcriptional regulator C-terminal domain-containing protein [Agromyces]MCD5348158.1 TetR/AcrR family transcriptional regulator C-terminal domain-containing protein [Agromyces sp. S2-1-8]MDF0514238.1 TetR/AcrR family transcriptional regulator C-terminal domain-containing protein [Agromyces chromiiresistens]